MFPRLFLICTLLLAVFGLAACDSSGYRKQKGQWAHGDTVFTPSDPHTFEPIDDLYASDSVHGYYRGSEIDGSDGSSFTVVAEHEARDRNHVYYCDTFRKAMEYWSIKRLRVVRIAGADPLTYRAIGNGYSRDKRSVYSEGIAIVVRDPATFEPLGGHYAHDSQRGYFSHVEIRGSHGASFEIVDERDVSYARDQGHVYHAHDGELRTLREASPATLRVLGRGYAADARHVWHRGHLLDGADAATFVVDESYYGPVDATDRSGAWRDGERLREST